MSTLAAAFRRRSAEESLPRSIRGLWKADLFLGSPGPDRWVGTSVKINRSSLETAAGLRVGIIPTQAGSSDAVAKDDHRNLVICPLPHDYSFMQVFYEGLRIVQALCTTDFQTPSAALLPNPAHREVARMWVERRDLAVVDVVEAVAAFAQPHLLETEGETVTTVPLDARGETSATSTLISPFPLIDS